MNPAFNDIFSVWVGLYGADLIKLFFAGIVAFAIVWAMIDHFFD